MKGKQLLMIAAMCLTIVMAFAACTGGSPTPAPTPQPAATAAATATPAPTTAAATATPAPPPAPADNELPFVEFSWYLGLNPMPDNQMVNDAINEYIAPILNAKVNIFYWPSSDWETRMTVMVASGDDLGIIGFGTQSKLDYVIQSQRGSFYPLNDLLEEYGQGTKALFSQAIWDSTKINGNIYGIPSLKDNCYIISMIYNADMAEKLDIDMTKVNYRNFSSLIEPFFNMVMDKRDEVYGDLTEPLSGGLGLETPYMFAAETFLQDSNLIVCNIDGIMDFAGYDSKTVFNLYATDEYRETMKAMQRMVDRNILAYDYTGQTAWSPSGNMFAWPGWGYSYMPEHLFSDTFVTKMVEPERVWTDTNNIISAGTAISSNAKEPERLMMFLEMVNTDPKLATMMRFGVEGQHYLRDADGYMTFEDSPRNSDTANRGYHYWYAAPVGNLLIVEAPLGYSGPDGIMLKKIGEYNANAAIPSHLGFIFDIEPVTNEIAACTSVVLEYRGMLRQGQLSSGEEVDQVIDEFLAKLEANGVQAILEDAQRQMDEWRAR